MKVGLDIKVNAYTTLSLTSDFADSFPDNSPVSQLLLKVPQGPSIRLINEGMDCLMEFPGKQFIPGKIENVSMADEGALLTVGYEKKVTQTI
jgi:hypothetical protein